MAPPNNEKITILAPPLVHSSLTYTGVPVGVASCGLVQVVFVLGVACTTFFHAPDSVVMHFESCCLEGVEACHLARHVQTKDDRVANWTMDFAPGQ